MIRASYRAAIAWIAANDDPETKDQETIHSYISVKLVADLFDVTDERVAGDVARKRAAMFPEVRP